MVRNLSSCRVLISEICMVGDQRLLGARNFVWVFFEYPATGS